MAIDFGNIQGNIVDSTGAGPGAVSPPSNQGSLYVTGGPHSSGPRKYKRRTIPTPSSNQMSPAGPGQQLYNPNLSVQNELENLVQQKNYLQQQPSENVPGVNLYQEKMQDFITSSPLNREIYKDRFPIGGAFNLFMTEAPANIAKMSPVGNMVSGILNAFNNNNKKEKTISDTMFAYEQPLDVYKSRTTEAPYQDTFENVQITDTMGSSDIISGLPKVGSPRDTRLEFLLGQENKTAKDLDEIMRLTKERNEKYKSPGLGAEAQSVDPLAVNIKPKQKPGIEQLIESMNRTLKSNTSIDPNYVSPSAVNVGTFTDGTPMYVNPNVPTLYSNTNPFKLRIMGQDYDGIRSRLYDQGVLNPNASSADALKTLNSLSLM